jgi:hypothetical protein
MSCIQYQSPITRRRLKDAQDDLPEAKDDIDRTRLEREIAIAEAMIEAGGD